MPKALNKSIPQEVQHQIVQDYKSNVSIRELNKKYGYSRASLSKLLEELNVKSEKGNHYRKYFHDEDFFETIDSEEKAYWLGFMFADGYIVNNENRYGQDAFGLSLAEDSLSSIEQFKKSLKANNPIRWDYSRIDTGRQPLCKLVLTSQKTVNDLISKGCVKQKTLILEPPKDVPDELIRHFIRGFFDGDGSLVRHQRKDSSHIAFGINFTTTKPFAEWLLKINNNIGNVYKEQRREHTWYYGFSGNQQVIKFYHWLYDDATIWMDRKYQKFQELLEKYGENRGI